MTSVRIPEHILIDDVWLPVKYEWYNRSSQGPQRTTHGSFEYVSLNPEFSDDDFKIEFPRGTYVRDEIAEVSYRTGDAVEIPEIDDEMVLEEAGDDMPTAVEGTTAEDTPSETTPAPEKAPKPEKEKPKRSIARFILPLVVVIVIILAAMLLLKSRKPHGHK